MALKPSQLKDLLRKVIPASFPVLIKGGPGIGKTQITRQVTDELGYDLFTEIASMAEPTDYKGLPDVSGSVAVFKPFDNLERILSATKPTVWFFDDVAQSSEAIQNTIMHLFEDGMICGRKIPRCVTLLAASNDRGQKAGVRGMTTPFKSRFHTIVELEPDLDEACAWFLQHGMNWRNVAYLRTVPDALSEFEPTQDLTNFPCPRTWFKLSQLESLGLPASVESEAFIGAVGVARANGYLMYRSMADSMVNLDAILTNPASAPIPTRPDQLYAIAVGLSTRSNLVNFAAVATYVDRLITSQRFAEFGVLTIKDAIRRDEKLAHTETYTRLSSGAYGKLASGQA